MASQLSALYFALGADDAHGWLILGLTDSPFPVALVGFFSSAPMFLLGLVGGVLADRVHRQRLLILTQGTNVTSSFMLTLLLSTGAVQVWHAYMAILTTGTCWALDTPSRRAVIYDLLGLEGVTNAVALDSVGMNASRMCGPALAGVLITLTGVTGGYMDVLLQHCLGAVVVVAYRKGHAQSSVSRVPGVICARASASCAGTRPSKPRSISQR